MEVLREGYAIPFLMPSPLSPIPIILDSYSPQSVKGRALDEEIQTLCRKGAVEPAPPTLGFFSRMFVVTKATGCWRPMIDLSTLNLRLDRTSFRMETSQTILRAVRRNDWMVSLDLKDAHLQIPIPPAPRKYLRFTAGGKTWQFRVLCFGLSTAPQVFTRVMAPVSGFLHQLGIRMPRYLDDWLILASSQEETCWARDKVLSLCQEVGIVVNLENSTLTPSQTIVYLGIRIDSQTFRALATPLRIEKFFSIAEEFLSSKVQSAKFWRVLLGHLASLSCLVLNGQLQMRALQLALSRGWDFSDEDILVPWDPPSRDDLRWWHTDDRLEEGISLALSSPDQMFWSDASNLGWGATVAYGCYDPLQLRCTWCSLRPGWLLNLTLTGTYVWTFLLWTLAVPRDWVDLTSPPGTSRTLSHA